MHPADAIEIQGLQMPHGIVERPACKPPALPIVVPV
jgi:hypothetical protein